MTEPKVDHILVNQIFELHDSYETFKLIITHKSPYLQYHTHFDGEYLLELDDEKHYIWNYNLWLNDNKIQHQLHHYEKNSLENSSSYIGERDFYLYYSSCDGELSDYPHSMITDIGYLYVMGSTIYEVMDKLKHDDRFCDVDIMSPKVDMINTDNRYNFYVGFNLVK